MMKDGFGLGEEVGLTVWPSTASKCKRKIATMAKGVPHAVGIVSAASERK